MSIKKMFQLESETVTGASVKIPFEYTNRESIPAGKEVGNCIVVSPIKVVTWFKLKPLLLMFEKGELDRIKELSQSGFSGELAELMSKYDEAVFETVCTGIHNKRGNMPGWFREVLRDNCTWEDLCILLNAILFRIGCNPFLSSITALKAASPLREEEIIALQENAEAWALKAASCSSQS